MGFFLTFGVGFVFWNIWANKKKTQKMYGIASEVLPPVNVEFPLWTRMWNSLWKLFTISGHCETHCTVPILPHLGRTISGLMGPLHWYQFDKFLSVAHEAGRGIWMNVERYENFQNNELLAKGYWRQRGEWGYSMLHNFSPVLTLLHI